MKTRLLLSIFMVVSGLYMAAQIVNVPGDFSTIQEGIDAASDGDTVLVADGTYKEQISFKGKAITVASHFLTDGDIAHISNTIIDGNLGLPGDTASTVRFVSGEDTTSVLSGFTVQGGKGIASDAWDASRLGGGIACMNATAKISNNRIINNSVTHVNYGLGGGIGCYIEDSTAWLIVENNLISGNTNYAIGDSSYRVAAGAGLYASANVIARNNTVNYNESHSNQYAYSGGFNFDAPGGDLLYTVYCSNNDIQHNLVKAGLYGMGGGIHHDYNSLYLINNIISNNTIEADSYSQGGGVVLHGQTGASEMAVIDGNEIVGNKIKGAGWAGGSAVCINTTAFEVEFRNNKISGNTFEGENAAFATVAIYNDAPVGLEPQTRIEIESNLFTDNVSAVAGGIYLGNVINWTVANNLFSNNTAATYGGAMSVGNGSGLVETHIPVIANNTFLNNSAGSGGGAISNGLRVTLVTYNNLFWNDLSPLGNEIQSFFDSTLVVSNSLIKVEDISGKWEGMNNFYGNPELQEDSLHITADSPCLNAGVDEFVFGSYTYHCPMEDIDGEGRPMYEAVDVGADEYFVVGYDFYDEPVLKTDLTVYPNPVRNGATISFELNESEYCSLKVYNSSGVEIETLLMSELDKGKHEVKWNAASLPRGLYILRLISGQQVSTSKVVR